MGVLVEMLLIKWRGERKEEEEDARAEGCHQRCG
jgi:hypothetical protein